MIVVALVYAPLAPLVPLFAAAAFAISLWVYKYQVGSSHISHLNEVLSLTICFTLQLMYVSVSKIETGGRLWNVAINRVLIGIVSTLAISFSWTLELINFHLQLVMQALMALSVGLQNNWFWSIALCVTRRICARYPGS